MILGYKGKSEIDAAHFYCPYIPAFKIVRGERKSYYIDTHVQSPPPTQIQLRIMEVVRNPLGYT